MIKLNAAVALVSAVAMAGIKAALGEDLWWPFAIAEYLAAFLLVLGAAAAWRLKRAGLLAAGWGFTAGLTWSTLFHHLDAAKAGPVEAGLGVLLAVAAVGAGAAALSEPTH